VAKRNGQALHERSRGTRFPRKAQRYRDAEVALVHNGRLLMNYPIGQEAPIAVRLSLRVLDVDLGFWVDLYRGELVAKGHVKARIPFGRKWHTLVSLDNRGLARFDPSVGKIGGQPAAYEPELPKDPAAPGPSRRSRFGDARLCSPEVLRFYVADKPRRWMAPVGQIVKREMFPSPRYGDFVFNTVACVGEPDDDENLGRYTDPRSLWFNVFFGYYQIDVPIAQWKNRPFGYASDDGFGSAIEAEDLVRLGKADWNWFSNWMYGVPEQDIRACDKITDDELRGVKRLSSPFEAGSRWWHRVELGAVKVASSYESGDDGAAKLIENTPLWRAWRDSFGLPNPQRGEGPSFFPTMMRGQVYMSYEKDEQAGEFHTRIFGGTVRADGKQTGDEQAFLDDQLEALGRLIGSRYGALGFVRPASAEDISAPAPPSPERKVASSDRASTRSPIEQSSENPAQSD
jgi:hypothetical protein